MSSFEKEPAIQLNAKQVKKNPYLSLMYMKAPHGVVYASTNRCSFQSASKREQQKGKRPSQIDTVMYHGGNIQVRSCGGLCNQHVCKMPIKYSSVGIYLEVI